MEEKRLASQINPADVPTPSITVGQTCDQQNPTPAGRRYRCVSVSSRSREGSLKFWGGKDGRGITFRLLQCHMGGCLGGFAEQYSKQREPARL